MKHLPELCHHGSRQAKVCVDYTGWVLTVLSKVTVADVHPTGEADLPISDQDLAVSEYVWKLNCTTRQK